jgi:hypothetical protein
MIIYNVFIPFYSKKSTVVIYYLADFVHIWYNGWVWSEHVHIIPIFTEEKYGKMVILSFNVKYVLFSAI